MTVIQCFNYVYVNLEWTAFVYVCDVYVYMYA